MAGNLIQPYSGNTILNPYGTTAAPVGTRVSFQFWRQPVFQYTDGTYYTPGVDGPTYATSPWDKLEIDATVPPPYVASGSKFSTPGICKVRVTKYRDVDKKKSAGSDGARVTIHGMEPAQLEIELMIWTPEQLRQLAAMWPVLSPAAYKGSPAAYDVRHPALSGGLHSVSSVQFVSLDGPEIDSRGVGTFRMKAWEFLKPGNPNVSVTKTAAAPTPTLYDTTNSPAISTPGSSSANTAP